MNCLRLVTATLLVLLFLPLVSFAQWAADTRLTNDTFESVTCFNNARSVASFGDNVHVVWHDNRGGNTQVYYKHSMDNGAHWAPDTALTTDPSWSERPAIALADSVVHVVWYDGRLGPPRIFYKRSSDNGTTWGSDISLTPTSGVAYHPSVTVSGSTVHVVWTDMGAGPQIYYTRSLDNGSTWETARNITPTSPPAGKNLASVAASGSIVHVAWMDFRAGGQIYYTRSTDDGATWETDRALTPATSQFSSIAVSGSLVHIVYSDFRYGLDVPKIFYVCSLDDGMTWEPEVQLSDGIAAWYPSIAVSGSLVHVVWLDNRNGDVAELYYMRSLDDGANWGTEIRLTDNPSESREPSVAVSGQYVHVVWHDDRDGNWEIYYKRKMLHVSLALTPDATIVQWGERLRYEGTVFNNTPETQDFEYWAEVTLPDGDTGEFGPWRFSLATGDTLHGHRSHRVCRLAPLGDYSYRGMVGIYPSEIWDEDGFDFSVIAGRSNRISGE